MHKPRATPLRLESLETREVLSGMVSISVGAATEGAVETAFLGAINGPPATLDGVRGLVTGADGMLYAVSTLNSTVERFDPQSGDYLGVFVASGSGGLDRPTHLAFGPDGHLYVSSPLQHSIFRFDGATGAYIDTYVAAGSGGLDNARGLVFDSVGNLLVASRDSDQILRYQGPMGVGPGGETPGEFLGVFAETGAGTSPADIAFGPDGNLFVSNIFVDAVADNGRIDRYHGQTGAHIDTYVASGVAGIGDTRALLFDQAGTLYVTEGADDSILRFQGPNQASPGAFIDAYVPPGLGGVDGPIGAAFGPDGNLYVSSLLTNQLLRYGAASQAAFTISLDAPSATPVSVGYSTANGSATAASDYEANAGVVTFAPGETAKTVIVKTLDDIALEGNETFVVNLSNPSGATIADGQGVGTIVDNETPPTKFYVVDDATANKTYEYGSSGAAVENYSLNSGNTAPRGAASTAAGDKVWIVDNNRKVYVYDTSGGLLGSWTAGTLASNAQPQGIATNGADVWIVDARSDKVFKYTGAATRLSGSQNAASSFNLASGNGAPSDIVTDGNSFWVTNDASQDKVFKYTIAGGSLGNWTITASGGSPTGITLDPASPAHLWIVDSATDRVYQYDNAVSRTSGSQAASTSFALAAGNANPQGIADPPVAGVNVERNSFRTSPLTAIEATPEEKRKEFRFASETALAAQRVELLSALSTDREDDLEETIALLALQCVR